MEFSISTSMPVPWHLYELIAASTRVAFQSQPRCQAPGDTVIKVGLDILSGVSISTEMPGPWRRPGVAITVSVVEVSISTEMPGPWRHRKRLAYWRSLKFQSQP